MGTSLPGECRAKLSCCSNQPETRPAILGQQRSGLAQHSHLILSHVSPSEVTLTGNFFLNSHKNVLAFHKFPYILKRTGTNTFIIDMHRACINMYLHTLEHMCLGMDIFIHATL